MDGQAFANSKDPVQTLHNAASDQSQHSLTASPVISRQTYE